MEYRANDMLAKGLELLEAKEEDRGLKMIQTVPQMFPKTKARFCADLAIGKYQMGKHQYDLAAKAFGQLAESADPEEHAEGLYQAGIPQVRAGKLRRRLHRPPPRDHRVSLERLRQRSLLLHRPMPFQARPLGQGHRSHGAGRHERAGRHQGRGPPRRPGSGSTSRSPTRTWSSSIPPRTRSRSASAPRAATRKKSCWPPSERAANTGWARSRPCSASRSAGDGLLQISGGDEVTVSYVNRYTSEGKVNQQVLATVSMVSTASVGFTDGAFREYVQGVFAEEPAFLRVKDMNRSVSKEPAPDHRQSLLALQGAQGREDRRRRGGPRGALQNPRHHRDHARRNRLAHGDLHRLAGGRACSRPTSRRSKATASCTSPRATTSWWSTSTTISMVSREPRTIAGLRETAVGPVPGREDRAARRGLRSTSRSART